MIEEGEGDRAIPLPILAVLAFGYVTSAYLLRVKPWSTGNGAWDTPAEDVTRSNFVPPGALLAYRALLFLYTLALGCWHTYTLGFHTLRFFTMWTWWLLTAYFGLAAHASWRALRPQGRRDPAARVDRREYAIVALLHTILPAVLLVDLMTWTVLVPMLLANEDPARVAWARGVFFSFLSYNTHGANAVFALGELLLSRIPFHAYLGGYLGLYAATFGLWGLSYYKATGKWLYPFLDVHQPWSLGLYTGVYGACWAFGALATAQFLLRGALVRLAGRPRKARTA